MIRSEDAFTIAATGAAACAAYLEKGRQIAVTGRLIRDEWQAKDGTKRSKHHVIGRVAFGSEGRSDGNQVPPGRSTQMARPPTTNGVTPAAPAAGSSLRLDGPLLRPEQAAELLSVKTSWIYEAVRTNKLPCLRIGRHIRFTRTMLEEWLEARGR